MSLSSKPANLCHELFELKGTTSQKLQLFEQQFLAAENVQNQRWNMKQRLLHLVFIKLWNLRIISKTHNHIWPVWKVICVWTSEKSMDRNNSACGLARLVLVWPPVASMASRWTRYPKRPWDNECQSWSSDRNDVEIGPKMPQTWIVALFDPKQWWFNFFSFCLTTYILFLLFKDVQIEFRFYLKLCFPRKKKQHMWTNLDIKKQTTGAT